MAMKQVRKDLRVHPCIFLRAVVDWQCFLVDISNALGICCLANHHQRLVHPVVLEHVVKITGSFCLFVADASFSDLDARVLLGSIL